eukprot:gene9718-20206_t
MNRFLKKKTTKLKLSAFAPTFATDSSKIMKQSSLFSFFKNQSSSDPLKPIIKDNKSDDKSATDVTMLDIHSQKNIKENNNIIEPSENDFPSQKSNSSSYEQLRLENIRRNSEFLEQLGLCPLKSYIGSTSTNFNETKLINRPKKRKTTTASSNANLDSEHSRPLRRSSRLSNIVTTDQLVLNNDESLIEINQMNSNNDDDNKNSMLSQIFDSSNVLTYILSTYDPQTSNSTSNEIIIPLHNAINEITNQSIISINNNNQNSNSTSTSSLPRFKLQHNNPIFNDELNAIYTMQFHSKYRCLLLAAGKGGNVTAHNRWICNAQFLNINNYSTSTDTCTSSTCSSTSIPIITASDDASVKIWDISLQQRDVTTGISKAKLLTQNQNIHTKGIFCLDVNTNNLNILTGSKDTTICLSKIRFEGGCIEKIRTFESHTRVVKTVTWLHKHKQQAQSEQEHENSNIFLSGGNDCSIHISDIRSSKDTEFQIDDIHKSCIHSIICNPFSENEFLFASAGLDDIINVFDFRKLSTSSLTNPIFKLQGHCGYVKKFQNIIAPKFINGHILGCIGENSNVLSLYCLQTGSMINRVVLPEQPMMLAINYHDSQSNDNSCSNNTLAVACRRSGVIYTLDVIW